MQSTPARTLVLGIGALLLGAAVHAQNAPTTPAPGATRILSVATLAPAGSNWMRGLDAANRELRRRTNGAVAMRFYAGGVQGDESEMVRKMRQGRLDGAVMTGIGLGQIHRPVLAFMLPGMFPSREAMGRARTSLTQEVEAQFTAQNFTLAVWGESGSPRLFSTREIHTPNDLRQARPWIWRDDVVLPAFYTEAGATGVPLSLPEVLSALQTHRIDTFIAPPYASVALQWSSQIQYVSEGTGSFTIGGIVFTKRSWEGVPEAQRPVFREILTNYSGIIARNVARDDEVSIRSMVTRGVRQVAYTPAEREQWRSLFARAQHRLVGVISDQAWMDRVHNAR